MQENRDRSPSVDSLIRMSGLEGFSFEERREAARSVQRDWAVSVGTAEARMMAALTDMSMPQPAAAINATGVILHTGLGRTRLSDSAARAIQNASESHVAVELDLASGERGDRQAIVREQLMRLTGAEDALVVNNCAGALFLTLSALCSGREVLLSRGQMVEIGGSFRMPDVIQASGCRLVEVGCTNRTHRRDYADAITDATGAILRCSPSNFWMDGFVSSVPIQELADLGPLVIDDMGSGNLVNTQALGLPATPTMMDSTRAGSALVLASGDKLLGGPQAGLIVGRADLIATIKRHPVARAMRVDKFTLAGLRATLDHYIRGELHQIPTWRAMLESEADLTKRTKSVMKGLRHVQLVRTTATVGGGSLPEWKIPSVAIEAPGELAPKLRMWRTPVIGRMERGKVILDLRTCTLSEQNQVRSALESLLSENK